ncbi:hypothetical protein B0T25DRAFT_535813 [Lasiosphaeria hispida]|uniref:Uncharacterized protein n=1 Tax=Lasiosphaeria hispida TaxID=260671 RepID=A0AAJ0HSH4_9PEZI|nr:hypothetical protein B0T25DRAFT_535813 [Lasiosphaeria hispida]
MATETLPEISIGGGQATGGSAGITCPITVNNHHCSLRSVKRSLKKKAEKIWLRTKQCLISRSKDTRRENGRLARENRQLSNEKKQLIKEKEQLIIEKKQLVREKEQLANNNNIIFAILQKASRNENMLAEREREVDGRVAFLKKREKLYFQWKEADDRTRCAESDKFEINRKRDKCKVEEARMQCKTLQRRVDALQVKNDNLLKRLSESSSRLVDGYQDSGASPPANTGGARSQAERESLKDWQPRVEDNGRGDSSDISDQELPSSYLAALYRNRDQLERSGGTSARIRQKRPLRKRYRPDQEKLGQQSRSR